MCQSVRMFVCEVYATGRRGILFVSMQVCVCVSELVCVCACKDLQLGTCMGFSPGNQANTSYRGYVRFPRVVKTM